MIFTISVVVVVALVLFLAWLVTERVPVLNVRDKHIWITGGSSGIGLALAEHHLRAGARVTLVARRVQVLDDAKRELESKVQGAKVQIVAADVVSDVQVREAVASAEQTFGKIDVAVLSAGISVPGNFSEISIEDHERVMRVNYMGSLNCARSVLASMCERTDSIKARVPLGSAGRLVFVSSMAGLAGVTGFTAYSPSKFAVRGLAETLQMEYRARGVLVSVVNPPDVDTPMLHAEMAAKPEACKQISAGSGLFSAERVAADIADGIANWRFMISTGFDGVMLSALTAGMSPVSSIPRALLETLLLGVIRLVSLAHIWHFNRICERCRLDELRDN
jgi:3-dehydrosphinganine reductase